MKIEISDRLHLGCGRYAVKGWTNVTAGNESKEGVQIVKFDLERSDLPLERNSLSFVYGSHFLEHLSWHRAKKLMSNLFVAMKPGGVLRLAIPDLAYFVADYAAGRMSCLAVVNAFETKFGRKPLAAEYFMHAVNSSCAARLGHKYMYDAESLKHLFAEAGFFGETRKFRESVIPDIGLLEPVINSEHTVYIESVKTR